LASGACLVRAIHTPELSEMVLLDQIWCGHASDLVNDVLTDKRSQSPPVRINLVPDRVKVPRIMS
jgi:hypothetical protein